MRKEGDEACITGYVRNEGVESVTEDGVLKEAVKGCLPERIAAVIVKTVSDHIRKECFHLLAEYKVKHDKTYDNSNRNEAVSLLSFSKEAAKNNAGCIKDASKEHRIAAKGKHRRNVGKGCKREIHVVVLAPEATGLSVTPKTPIATKPAAAPAVAGGSKVTCPLPGTVISLNVKEGDTVAAGQTLLVLEAMKMENNIDAERGGVVKQVLVQAGATVMEGDVLLVIE